MRSFANLTQDGQPGKDAGVDAVGGAELVPFGFRAAEPIPDAGGDDVLLIGSVADRVPVGQHHLVAGVDEVLGVGVAVDQPEPRVHGVSAYWRWSSW